MVLMMFNHEEKTGIRPWLGFFGGDILAGIMTPWRHPNHWTLASCRECAKAQCAPWPERNVRQVVPEWLLCLNVPQNPIDFNGLWSFSSSKSHLCICLCPDLFDQPISQPETSLLNICSGPLSNPKKKDDGTLPEVPFLWGGYGNVTRLDMLRKIAVSVANLPNSWRMAERPLADLRPFGSRRKSGWHLQVKLP
jgi:hypothetical protein